MENDGGLFSGNVEGIKSWYSRVLYPSMMSCEANIIREVYGRNCYCNEHAAYSTKDINHKRKRTKRKNKDKKQHIKHKQCKSASLIEAPESDDMQTEDKSDTSSVREDLQQFLNVTAMHKEKQKLKKEKEKGRPVEYVLDVDDPLHVKPTSFAPEVHAGTIRNNEMVKLYGVHAPDILSIEAKMQAQFNLMRSATQPNFWPVIPLNLNK
ncbi:uncharacterized protein LOC100178833 [Ciona intestinalis]